MDTIARLETFLVRLCLGVALALAGALVGPVASWADGTLPPQPYRYLHPPPALASENYPPESGSATIGLAGGRSKAGFVFTKDTQAGVVVSAGALRAAAPATSILIRISPVETPSGLPQHYVAEGNAYTITATGQPGNTPVQVVHAVNLTLRWPLPPLAIYDYAGGRWKQLCYSDNATFTSSTMACPTKSLGTFTAVSNPALTGGTPPAPISQSRFAWINRYIPLLVAVIVLLATAVLAFLAIRPDKNAKEER